MENIPGNLDFKSIFKPIGWILVLVSFCILLYLGGVTKETGTDTLIAFSCPKPELQILCVYMLLVMLHITGWGLILLNKK